MKNHTIKAVQIEQQKSTRTYMSRSLVKGLSTKMIKIIYISKFLLKYYISAANMNAS